MAQLAESIAEISHLEKAEKEKKKNDICWEHIGLAPKAREKLQEKQGDVSKLSYQEGDIIHSLCLLSIDSPPVSSVMKDECMKALKDAIDKFGSPMDRHASASEPSHSGWTRQRD